MRYFVLVQTVVDHSHTYPAVVHLCCQGQTQEDRKVDGLKHVVPLLYPGWIQIYEMYSLLLYSQRDASCALEYIVYLKVVQIRSVP